MLRMLIRITRVCSEFVHVDVCQLEIDGFVLDHVCLPLAGETEAVKAHHNITALLAGKTRLSLGVYHLAADVTFKTTSHFKQVLILWINWDGKLLTTAT